MRAIPQPSSAFRADVVWIPAGLIKPNPWNPNHQNAFQFSKLLESIQTYGFIDPLLVRPQEGNFQIIGGEHRHKAGTQLAMTEFPCIVKDVDDAMARKLSLIDNELHGQADPTELTDLLKDLLSSSSPEEMLVGLPYTDDILKGFLGFDPQPIPEPAPPSGGDSSPPEGVERWLERTYRIPVSVAVVIDEAIAKAKATEFAESGRELPDFGALEILAAEYLAGN